MKQTKYMSQSFTPGLTPIQKRLDKFVNGAIGEGWQLLTVTESVDKTFKRTVTAHLVRLEGS